MEPLGAEARRVENDLKIELRKRAREEHVGLPPRGGGAGAPTTMGYRFLRNAVRQYAPGDDVNENSLRAYLLQPDHAIPERVLYGLTRALASDRLNDYDRIVALRAARRSHRRALDPAELDAGIARALAAAGIDDWCGARDEARSVLAALSLLPEPLRAEPMTAWLRVKAMHIVAHSAMPTGDVLKPFGRNAAIHAAERTADLAKYFAELYPRADVPQPFEQIEWDGRSTRFQTICDTPQVSFPWEAYRWLEANAADRYAAASDGILAELMLRDAQMRVQHGQLVDGIDLMEDALELAEHAANPYSFICISKDLGMALEQRGRHTEAKGLVADARSAAGAHVGPLLDVRLGVAELRLSFDPQFYEDVRTRAVRGDFLHQANKADKIAKSQWDRSVA